MSLNRFFLRLIGFGTLPLVALAIALATWHLHGLYRQQAESAARVTHNFAAALDAELSSRIEALEVLAGSTSIAELDLPAVYAEATAYHRALGGHVILADLQQQMLVNTRVPYDTILPKLPRPEGRSAVAEVIASGKPAVGDLVFGPVAQTPLVALAVPVRRGGRLDGTLLSTLSTERLERRIAGVVLPPGTTLSLLDSVGAVIAESGEGPGSGGATRQVDVRLSVAPWTVALEVQRTVFYQSMIAVGALLALGIAALASLAVFLVSRAGAQVRHELAWMTSPAAERSARGPGIDEIGEAARTLDAARDQLAKSEAFFRTLVVGSSQAVWHYRFDADGRGRVDEAAVIWWQEFTGEPVAPPPADDAQDWPTAVHPEDRAHALAFWRGLGASQDAADIRLRVRRHDGEWRWLDLHSVAIRDQDRIVEYAGTVIDVTDRINAEAAERLLNARITSMLERMSDGFVMMDSQWRYVYANRRATEMLARRPEELIGQSAWELFPHTVDTPVHEACLAAQRHGTSSEVEQYDTRFARWYENRIHGGPEGVSIYFRDITDSKIRELELRDANERLQALSARVIAAQEFERRQIARELHDQIGQALTALKITLQSVATQVDAAAPKRQLEQGAEIADGAIRQVRTLSLDLRPPQLDDLGLAAALRWYLGRQAEIAGFAGHFSDQGTPPDLPDTVAISAYRIAQEAVTNAMRHAQAQNLWVTTAVRDGTLTLEIRDDGCGFAGDADRPGEPKTVGLASMRERAALAGGVLHVDSQPGSGTRVRAELPTAAAAAAENP